MKPDPAGELVDRRAVAETFEGDGTRKARILAIDDAYHDPTRALVRFLDDRGLPIGYEGVLAWAAYLRSRNYAAATFNKCLAAAKNRLRLLFRDSPEALDVLAAFKLDSMLKELRAMRLASRQIDRHKVISAHQVHRLVSSSKVPLRVRLFIEFMATTGVRVSELCSVRLQDVSTDHGVSVVRIHGKGQKERKVMIRRELVDRIRSAFRGGEFLFETRGGGAYARQYVTRQVHLAGELVLGRKICSITQDMYVHEDLTLEDLVLEGPRGAGRASERKPCCDLQSRECVAESVRRLRGGP